MDYEKLYKDTITNLQEMVDSGKIAVKVARKICKDIISFVEQAIDSGYGIISKERKERWIAWLEKQGEQKPKFKIGDIIKKENTNDIVIISEIDLKNREYRLSNTGFIPFKYEHLWKLVEQKPSWSEEDERERKHCIDFLNHPDMIMVVLIGSNPSKKIYNQNPKHEECT